jgi:hypothetical protein
MTSSSKVRAYLLSTVAPAVIGAASLVTTAPALAAPCTGPGAPTTTETKCLTAIAITGANTPGNPLRSFDISFVNPDRDEYYFADRSNNGVDVIDTKTLTFKRTIGGFVGVVINPKTGAVDNNHSGPDGVTSHGKWLYAGDGDSTLKVIDLNAPTASAIKQTISTGGTTRVDEMALTTDGKLLIAANNAEDPPFATLFSANGDDSTSHTSKIIKIEVASTIIPSGAGLSIEQPAWDPTTQRFYTSIPIIANNPPGCEYGQSGPGATITCDGGLLVTDPTNLTASQCGPGSSLPTLCVQGAFDPTTNTGVIPLHQCGPNGATVGPNDNLLLGCTPANNPSNKTTLVINAKTHNTAHVDGITGSDEVWFNIGDGRYYTGSNRQPGGAVLGVIDGTSVLIETIPQSSGSHSVAADCKRNRIFVPQVAPTAVVGSGGDTTTVGAGICGGTNGCVGVYEHEVKGKPQGNCKPSNKGEDD